MCDVEEGERLGKIPGSGDYIGYEGQKQKLQRLQLWKSHCNGIDARNTKINEQGRVHTWNENGERIISLTTTARSARKASLPSSCRICYSQPSSSSP